MTRTVIDFHGDFPTWPWLRTFRAESIAREIVGSFALWNASGAVYFEPRLSDDRASAALIVDIRQSPAVDEWAMMFGEALHQLRGALDSLVWEFSRLDGEDPPNPNQVMFPAKTTEEQWARTSQTLSKLPADVIDRIRQVQPFVVGGHDSALATLSRLNNDDKHRQLVTVAAVGRRFKVGREIVNAAGSIRVEVPQKKVALTQGATAGAVYFSTPLSEGLQISPFLTEARLVISRGDREWEVSSLLHNLVIATRAILEWVAGYAIRPPMTLRPFEFVEQDTVGLELVYADACDEHDARHDYEELRATLGLP